MIFKKTSRLKVKNSNEKSDVTAASLFMYIMVYYNCKIKIFQMYKYMVTYFFYL